MELRLRLKRFQPPGIDLGTASSASQRFIHWATKPLPSAPPSPRFWSKTSTGNPNYIANLLTSNTMQQRRLILLKRNQSQIGRRICSLEGSKKQIHAYISCHHILPILKIQFSGKQLLSFSFCRLSQWNQLVRKNKNVPYSLRVV